MTCTAPADLQEQVPESTLIQLTNEVVDFDTPATVNVTVVDSCIRYAGELIDAHLRGRYTLPLAEVPTVLRDIAITLVRYRLYVRRPEGDLPDTVKDDNKEARRQLEAIRDGKLTLGLQSTQKDVPESGEIRARAAATWRARRLTGEILMNVLPVLDAVLARLREKLPQLQVEYFPENRPNTA